jgi:hypothetical protein
MGSTLERLEDNEKAVNAQGSALVEQMAQVARLEQDLNALRGGIQVAMENLSKDIGKQHQNTVQFLQFLMQKQTGLERNLTTVSKMLTALVSELTEKALVSDASLLGRVRRLDEENERSRVEQMLAAGTIKEIESVEPSSLITVKQDEVLADGTAQAISEFQVLEVGAEGFPEGIRNALLGKKKGESAEVEFQGGKIKVTMISVYGMVTGERQGEAPAQSESEQPQSAAQ